VLTFGASAAGSPNSWAHRGTGREAQCFFEITPREILIAGLAAPCIHLGTLQMRSRGPVGRAKPLALFERECECRLGFLVVTKQGSQGVPPFSPQGGARSHG
jgi:hypothetical protein